MCVVLTLNWYHRISHATAEILYKTPLLQLGSTTIQEGGDGPLHYFNLLTPNDLYRGRTAPLTFKVVFYIIIQQI